MKLGIISGGVLLCLFIIIGCSSDSEAPVISITAPNDDDTIRVHTSMITADASDNKDVEYVEFFVENNLVGTDSSTPYETSWSIASYDNMEVLTIHGNAHDFAGNTGQSDVIVVAVVTRGQVSGSRIDTVYILDAAWAEMSIVIANAPDSALVDSITVAGTIMHQQIADVDVYLQAPSSTEYQIWDNNFVEPTDTIMTILFENEDINGTWLLRIYDEVSNGLQGFVTDVYLTIYWKY